MMNELVSRKEIVGSWGVSHIRVRADGIRFRVAGFLYRGRVSIKAERGTYAVGLENVTFRGVTLEKVVTLIDSLVEKDGDYPGRIKDWIRSVMS